MTPIDPVELDKRFFDNPIAYDSASVFLFGEWQWSRGESIKTPHAVIRYIAMLGLFYYELAPDRYRSRIENS